VALLLLVVVLALAILVRRLSARVAGLETALAAAEDEPAAGPAPGQAGARTTSEPASYVITGLDAADEAEDAARLPAPVQGRIDGVLFADIVAREGVIRAAGVAHGLRRALAPEVRHRIRFEMRREVKRSRKQRRADLKAALRDLQARERAVADRSDEGDAA
jgi:hypothetical protein